MLILREQKLVYIDVPKTGSISLDTAFKELGAEEIRADKLELKHNRFIPEWAIDFKRIASIRNPYDRMLSHWNFGVQREWVKGGLEEFVDLCISKLTLPNNIRNTKISNLYPLHKYLSILQPISYYIRLESIKRDIENLPIKFKTPLRHKNGYAHPTFEAVATPEIIRKINIWAGPDFEMFGYERIN